ncbi:flavin reductase family protein [Streptomyces sp. NPDC052236]|uniref:flavin reductase family protein n=1 Tax=Streptomyces sp. NPDC052236 TaxID=3365686 RepID=UPI0037D479D1
MSRSSPHRRSTALSAVRPTRCCPCPCTRPGLLISLTSAGRTAHEIRSAGGFAVNVLSWEQRELTRRFAEEPARHRFAGVPWVSEGGQPVLAGSAAGVVCAVESCYDVWDHTLLVGRVLRSAHHPDRTPLLYHRHEWHPFLRTSGS